LANRRPLWLRCCRTSLRERLSTLTLRYIIPYNNGLVQGFRPKFGHGTDIKADMLSKEAFLKHLRNDLNHLYDPDHLRGSPLAGLFGVANRFDTAAALRRILTEAIESLEPDKDESPQSPRWQIYEPLLYRYVEQLSPQEVADQLAITVRHLRRKKRAALEVLAEHLWQQYDLGAELGRDPEAAATRPPDAAAPTVNQELAWLKNASHESITDLSQTLPAVLDLAKRLATQYDVHLDVAPTDTLFPLAIHPVALRQTLLSLLNVVIPRAAGGRVAFSARPLRWETEIRVECDEYPSGPKPVLSDESASLNMAQRLADMGGFRLLLSADARAFNAVLALPALEQLPVLIIDDNTDTLQLLKRYASGTRYHLITTRDPEQALSIVEQGAPKVIVLDVMMPQADGWEVLERLRAHPLTADIPIIVCTILDQKRFALFLGASGFVHKPITRQAFLEALDEQVELMAIEPS
jgi:CheY-like chemotaxis protein